MNATDISGEAVRQFLAGYHTCRYGGVLQDAGIRAGLAAALPHLADALRASRPAGGTSDGAYGGRKPGSVALSGPEGHRGSGHNPPSGGSESGVDGRTGARSPAGRPDGSDAAQDGSGCTGLTARWCPIHGDCTCDRDDYGSGDMNDPTCPLHRTSSTHAERDAQPAADVETHWGVDHGPGGIIRYLDETTARHAADRTTPLPVMRRTQTTGPWQPADTQED